MRQKHILKFGKARGKQRLRCKDCNRTFTPYTKTVFADTKLPLSVWLKYADCMGQQMTLRKTAKELGISLKTSFYLRHKILSAIKIYIGVDNLGGVVEMDETFLLRVLRATIRKVIQTGRNQGKGANKWITEISVTNKCAFQVLLTEMEE